ncbi:zinc-binding protein A33-like [Engraulis encrasicolus]|uniref:zinc-binding protein A33-like n=1 Tax=Engraulis encrasicolus TaxID=184585 RepID=UPI002FD5C427
MSENIYEDEESFNTTRPTNKAGTICMNEVPKGSQQRTEHEKTPDSSAGHYRYYKLAVVVVCALILAITIALCVTILRAKDLQLRYQNLAEEKDQLQLKYNNMTVKKAQLDDRNAILIHHESQLETNFSAVTAERDQLQKRLGGKERKRKDLQSRYDNLDEEIYQLQLQYNIITAEKAQLGTKFSAERYELQRRLGELEPSKVLQCHSVDKLTHCNGVTWEQHDTKTTSHDDPVAVVEYLIEYEQLSGQVDVILDPDTAQPSLILSADGKQVTHGYVRQSLPDTPKRFNPVVIVLGREGFSSGKFYYEVQVKGKTGWTIGVAKESVNRKEYKIYTPENGYWGIWLRDGTYYKALDSPRLTLSLKGKPQSVGVSVDYDAGLVSFYDADCGDHIYSFTNVSFTEKIYPFFSPYLNVGGENSEPLVISPVHICPNK